MSAVSVVIPNYNGQSLLTQHLPAVLKAMRSGDELIIIDDASTDSSWEWLSTQFKVSDCEPDVENYFSKNAFMGCLKRGCWTSGQKKGDLILLLNEKNQRFGQSCNAAVEKATKPLVFLINSDVSPHSKTIQNLVENFEDPSVFAVGCLEHEQDEKGKEVLSGKNTLQFQRGMFNHNKASSFESGSTAWASGGSSMFDRQKWIELGGFDSAYYPAYWEDVDLSFRARKRGWKVLFDAKAEVDHNHESTNTTAFGQKKMTKMSWQHAQTFVAKNGTWKQKLAYLLWQPYWWIRGPFLAPQQLQLIFIGLIIVLAAALRLFKLAEVPHGMTWDEAAIGYNGWSVATRGRDEWLAKVPISFRSFGDYKAPLAIYIVGAFTRFIDLNLFAIRLPFAFAGISAVVGMMLLTKLLWQKWLPHKPQNSFPILDSNNAALLAGFLMAVSPWHVHYSRIGFESGMALNFLLWGVVGVTYLFTYPIKNVQHVPTKLFRGVVGLISAVSLAASLYTYHSSKMVTPLVLLLLVFYFRKSLQKHWKNVLVWCLLLGLLLVPLVFDTVFGKGGGRFQQASVFRLGYDFIDLTATLVQNFVIHFSPAYLVQGQTDILRHGDGRYGVLYLTELFLILSAILGYAYQWFTQKKKFAVPNLLKFAILWVIIGVLPAAIGVDVPHSNRMLLALPGFIFLSLLGWQWIAQRFKDGLVAPAVLGMTMLIQTFLVVSYVGHYYSVYAQASAADFEDGYIEAIEYAKKYEPEVDQILFTTEYQQPYIYALLGRKTNTYEYHNGSLIKYLFTDKINKADIFRPNVLIVGTPTELDPSMGTHLVYGSDGKVRFIIVKTK